VPKQARDRGTLAHECFEATESDCAIQGQANIVCCARDGDLGAAENQAADEHAVRSIHYSS